MSISIRMTPQEFRRWREWNRARARAAALAVAPLAQYVRGYGWTGPGWEKAMIAYCEALTVRN